jgi:hypothetical protein
MKRKRSAQRRYLGRAFSDVCIKRTQRVNISNAGQRSWLTANCNPFEIKMVLASNGGAGRD